jgi:phosphoglycolate phosphatase-like HAD superfamily hydrolase
MGDSVKVLALDFDGVISDSATESFVVAVRTYGALYPDSQIASLAGELHGVTGERIRVHPLYRDFLALMPLGNRAEDFGVVLHMLEAGEWVEDQGGYDARRAAMPAAFARAFHQRFYRERAALREADPEAWARLLGPYPPIIDLIRRRARDARLCIATAKDRPSVELLLDLYGIAELFPPEHVVDKEHGTTKRAHLGALRDRLCIEFPEITFVDDKLNHLEDVASLGVRCVLAAWGYNGERERRLARRAGHLVCSLADAEEKLFGDAAAGPEAVSLPRG